MIDPALRLTDEECHELFAALFPHGLAGDDVLAELAPGGWETSPLSAVAHPAPEQLYAESLRMHEGIASLASLRSAKSGAEAGDEPVASSPPPSLEQIRAGYQPQPFDAPREVRELVGMCLWDVFSNNHEASAADGRIADLGSHRSGGGFLAEVVNRSLNIPPGAAEEQEIARMKRMVERGSQGIEEMLAELAAERERPDRVYDYLDFYMGTQMVSDRADLTPIYRMIFRRLRAANGDWRYSFPRLYLADLRPLRDAMNAEQEESPAWGDYDPSAALGAAQEEETRDEEIAEMREKLDEAHRESVEAARDLPPPAVVAAYRDVYGSFPQGWPPEVEV